MMDRAERKALERKWDLLQQFYTQYTNWNPSGTELRIPIKRFTIKDRTKSEIRTILDVLQEKGIFEYGELDDDFRFTKIRHDQFIKEYALTSASYRGYNQKPVFDPKLSELTFRGKVIKILGNSKQASLCRIVFKNTRSIAKEWQNGDLFREITGDGYVGYNWRVVYNLVRELNDKIAAATQVRDLLLATKYTIRLNPKYL